MEIYADEKWKLPKKESRNSCNRSRREVAATEGAGHLLKGSGSTKEVQRKTPRSFSSRCASLVKEQRAKFYIMRQLCSTEATVISSVHMGGHSMLGCSATRMQHRLLRANIDGLTCKKFMVTERADNGRVVGGGID
ncbi:hypothetical protein GW17_00000686 [Ensete ventricosum]|nr:hypothetical protein GW17_00000686 [Ensete ventricosum]